MAPTCRACGCARPTSPPPGAHRAPPPPPPPGAPPPPAAPAVAEKSVPGPDEDVVTMAIEAARTALDRSGMETDAIGAVWVGTESKPYAVKPSATIVAEALGITPHVVAADMEFACKAGSEAMQAAVAFVGSGMVEGALAIGMD